MIQKALEVNRRLDAWQRKGGTPRWMVYQWLRTAPRMALTMLLFVVFLYSFSYLSTRPEADLQILGFGFIILIAFEIADVITNKVVQLREV